MKIVKIATVRKGLRKINEEIRYASCFEEEQFTSGIIAFSPTKNADFQQITHDDKDVVCHVLEGSGRLRVNGRRIQLQPGTVCHIPKGTPHDFAAGRTGELVLFYSLIRTGREDRSQKSGVRSQRGKTDDGSQERKQRRRTDRSRKSDNRTQRGEVWGSDITNRFMRF